MCFHVSCALLEFDIIISWILEFWRIPLWTNFSYSCIKDSTKLSSEGIFQLGMESLLEWKLETKIEYSEQFFLSTEITRCSSFLSIMHCLHCSARDLNFVKNCWIVSKLLGCKATSSFSKMCPRSSSCLPKNNSSFSRDYLGFFNPSR